MGMSREAIQMGRPSKMTSDCSSIHNSQQKFKNNTDAPVTTFDSSLNQDRQFSLGSLSVLPASKLTSARGYSDDINIQTDKPNPLLWRQEAFDSQAFSVDDPRRQMMGFEMFEPALKRLHSSEGYQSSPSLTGSFSPSGSISTTERSGSSDSNRSVLSASSPEMVTGLHRSWAATDMGTDGGVVHSSSFDSGVAHGSTFRVDKGRHLQTIHEQFNLPTYALHKLSEHLPNEFRHKKLNIPHTITSPDDAGQIAGSLDRNVNTSMTSDQLNSLQSKTLSELIEDMLHGSSANRTQTLTRQVLNEEPMQHFDFDTEFATLSTDHINSGSNSNFYKNSLLSADLGHSDGGHHDARNLYQHEPMASTCKTDAKYDLSNILTPTFNILESSDKLVHFKPYQLLDSSTDQYQFISSCSSSAMSAPSSTITSDVSSLGQKQLMQFDESNNAKTSSSSEQMDYTKTSPSCSTDNWLSIASSSSSRSSYNKPDQGFSLGSLTSTSSMKLSAEALTLDAEGMISSVDHHSYVYKIEPSDVLVKGDLGEKSSADNFIIDGLISLDDQISESRQYWQSIKLPDENVVFAGKHWEVVNRVLPSYNRFVQLGTNVNRKLRQDFDKWVEKRSPEECCQQLSNWIQTEVVPIYTLTSITYLKSLPGFTSFQSEDQGILIRLGQSQSRILVAALHWYDADERNFRNFLSWREVKYGSIDPYKEKLIAYAEKINQLELDSVESALLNVLIILATDYPGLKRPDLIEESQKQVLGTFRAYTTAKFGAPNTRLENLFRYIPEIRRLGLIHYKMTLTPTFGIATDMQKKSDTTE